MIKCFQMLVSISTCATTPRLQKATRGLRLFLRLLYVRATAPERFDKLEALQSHFADLSPSHQANMRGMVRRCRLKA